jgi:hypothetical protein
MFSLIEAFSFHKVAAYLAIYSYIPSSLMTSTTHCTQSHKSQTSNLKPPSTSPPAMRLTPSTSLLGRFFLTTANPITTTNTNTEVVRAANHDFCGWGYTLPGEKGKHILLLGDGEQHTELAGDEGKINSVFISLTCTCKLYG